MFRDKTSYSLQKIAVRIHEHQYKLEYNFQFPLQVLPLKIL